MQPISSYCEAILHMPEGNVHQQYHDHEYGFPIENDNELFARLVLEINQAGLSWTTILKKKEAFYSAYNQFDISTVANYDESKINLLLQDAGIIRNRLKINAAIYNAGQILTLQEQFGSFKNLIDAHHPMKKEEWVKLFKKTFRFTGGEIVNEFLVSTGYLPGAHIVSCPIYKKVIVKNPAWKKSV
jgi:DNA-3-methyladenine glycosylase I